MSHSSPPGSLPRTSLRSLLHICLLVTLAPSIPAQAPKPDPTAASKSEATSLSATTTLSVDARLVNLPVVVRDKKGALIQTLTKDDFVLRVDDHPQNIRYFDQDRNLPLTLGLLVDTSGSQRNALDEERTASSAFLDNMLTAPANREPDKAFIIQFAAQVELLQDVTASRPKLQAALREIDTASPSFSNGGGNNNGSQNDPNDPDNNGGNNGNNGNRGGNSRGRGGPRGGGGTALYDAAFLAADELMSKQKGRKAIIILSDGVDNASRESLTKAIEAAQRADTIIYAIYFKGEEGGNRGGQPPGRGGGGRQGGGIGFPGGGRFPGGGGGYPGGGGGGYPGGGGGGNRPSQGGNKVDGRKILDRMASETGGRLFEVSKKQTTADIYTQIAAELRAQYRLAFTPNQDTASDGYHEIDLRLSDSAKQKTDTVQTRFGYYTGK